MVDSYIEPPLLDGIAEVQVDVPETQVMDAVEGDC
jgi:hypothetical protein